ncbi:SET domain-containing protein [Tilletiaria anomala UBC 951]|uniref:SET domain-containing protein n=1 Tax=Tilletiaria anomala (strain ATCC 24038 / CBS 436.72 / UBC 951) TaxID=1037660 RepID=A0A066W2C2_TILAU|nr:SET domain-containing protein [Tilletiaria anomala UBC 951]KDN45234.1 SET domain-containing protein [Tilletiaria anomala UBC 951]
MEDPTKNLQRQHRNFWSWLATNGVKVNDAFLPGSDDRTGPGVFTSRNLKADVLAVQVPAALVISSVQARQALEDFAQLTSAAEAKTRKEELAEFSQHDIVVFYLFLARKFVSMQDNIEAGSSSNASISLSVLRHAEYVRMIPDRISTPLHYRPAELGLLRGTPLYSATVERRATTRRACRQALAWLASLSWPSARSEPLLRLTGPMHSWTLESIKDLDEDALDEALREPEDEPSALQLWRWAESAYGSRAFPPNLAYPRARNPIILRGRCWRGSELGPILIPGLDSINHGRGWKVTWEAKRGGGDEAEAGSSGSPLKLDLPDPSDVIFLTLHYDLEAGTQVFNNYGAKSNEEFLGSYGFVMEGGPDDSVSLVVGGGGSGRSDRPDGASRRRCYWTRNTRGVPDDLFDVIVSLLGIQVESEAVAVAPTESCDDTEQVRRRQAVRSDPEVQLEVNATLANMFEQKLATLQQYLRSRDVLPASSKREARTHIVEMIDTYVQGQLEILQSALAITSARADQLSEELDGI